MPPMQTPRKTRMSETAAPLRERDAAARLDALEARGAAQFDPPGVELIAALLARASRLGGAAGARLEARAAVHLTRLEAAHAAACARAAARLDDLERAGRVVAPGVRERLDAGDPISVLQAARRQAVAPSLATRDRTHARRRYREALADLETALCADREPPPEEHAGLLDGASLAARVLAEAEALSPAWRRSLVASLLDLASLMHLPEPPPPRRPR